jgi:hypothetical protein
MSGILRGFPRNGLRYAKLAVGALVEWDRQPQLYAFAMSNWCSVW